MGNSYIASNFRVTRVMVLRVVLVFVGLLLICYVERHSRKHSSCPHCSCNCVAERTLSSPLELNNSSFADCGRDEPDAYNELRKDLVALLSEEISLHENVTTDTLQRTKVLIMGAKRTSLHYQNEAEKCNAGIETCEGARERAEVVLIEERKLTALWMRRAHENDQPPKKELAKEQPTVLVPPSASQGNMIYRGGGATSKLSMGFEFEDRKQPSKAAAVAMLVA